MVTMDLGVGMDKKANDFTIIKNDTMRDTRLTASELGLLTYLQHLPETWNIVPGQLAERFQCSRNKIVRLLTDLADKGYIEVHQPRNNDGHFAKREWKLSKTGVPVKPGTDEWTLLSTNYSLPRTKIDKGRDSKWRNAYYEQKPDCCSQAAWNRWIDYKVSLNNNKRLGHKSVTLSSNRLASLHHAGYDANEIIEVTINRGWKGIGDKSYSAYARCKRDQTQELII